MQRSQASPSSWICSTVSSASSSGPGAAAQPRLEILNGQWWDLLSSLLPCFLADPFLPLGSSNVRLAPPHPSLPSMKPMASMCLLCLLDLLLLVFCLLWRLFTLSMDQLDSKNPPALEAAFFFFFFFIVVSLPPWLHSCSVA